MPVKYREFFWPTLVLIAVTSSVVALVPDRMRKVTPRFEEQSLLTARGTDSAPLNLATVKSTERQNSEQPISATAESDDVVRPEEQSREEQIEVEVITVQADGFEPGEITRTQGPFILAISNRSGATDLALHLDRVQGNRVHEVRLARGRTRWNQVFNLPPGEYVLSEENHPAWICRIKLTAR